MHKKNLYTMIISAVIILVSLELGEVGHSKASQTSQFKTIKIDPVIIEITEVVAPVVSLPQPVKLPILRKVARGSKLEAEHFSKISVSEGGFSKSESEAILQSLEDMRQNKSLLETMYGQSPHVTKRKPFTDPRQVWVSNLPMRGLEMPVGWVECTPDENGRPSPKGCSGNWKGTAKSWAKFREYTTKLYWSGVVPSVIDGVVTQWGGDMDYWRGVGRNFCPLNSNGTKNTYWGIPQKNIGKCLEIDQKKVERSRVLTAQVAASRFARRHLIPNIPD